MTKKNERLSKILDTAAAELEKEGVKFFLGVVDRQPKQKDGGKVLTQSDLSGEDFQCLLDVALPTRQDIINLGIWVGRLIGARSKSQTMGGEGNDN